MQRVFVCSPIPIIRQVTCKKIGCLCSSDTTQDYEKPSSDPQEALMINERIQLLSSFWNYNRLLSTTSLMPLPHLSSCESQKICSLLLSCSFEEIIPSFFVTNRKAYAITLTSFKNDKKCSSMSHSSTTQEKHITS